MTTLSLLSRRVFCTYPAVSRRMSSSCVFCKIVARESPANILYEDEQLLVFPDIRPAAEHHYLVIPKVHIVSIQSLTSSDIPLVESMERVGLDVLEKEGGDPSTCITGFHWPIHTVSHLHMHILSPQVDGFIKKIIFSNWFFGNTASAIKMLENK